MASTNFGDCNCQSMKSNQGIVAGVFHGVNRFDQTGNADTRYLRADRVILTNPLHPSLEISRPSWEGWYIENQWTGAQTKSAPSYIEPWNWLPSQLYNNTKTTRNIIFPQSVHDGDFVYYTVYITLLETLSIPITMEEFDESINDAILDLVPWDDPFIFDFAHHIQAYFRFDENGALVLREDVDPNPLVFSVGCPTSTVSSHFIYGLPDGTFSIKMGFRRQFRTAIQKRLGGQPRLDFCGVAPGTPFLPIEIIPARQIIMPPTQNELIMAGGVHGQWGHTCTLSC